MTGANTFGCLVNGEVWRPYVDVIGWGARLNVKHDRGWADCDQLYIGAKKITSNRNIHQEISINIWCPNLGQNKISTIKGAFIDFNKSCGYRYHIDTLSPHFVNVTKLDTINFIASGTFEFTAIHYECQDTIRITEGRFDADSSL